MYTMYNVKLAGFDSETKEQIVPWINEALDGHYQIFSEEYDGNIQIDIVISKINKSFDWVKINRLRKKHLQSKLIIIMDEENLKTAPIAVNLHVQALLLNPVRKNAFIGAIKSTIAELADLPIVREMFLRRLLYGEIKTEEELKQYQTLAKMESVPNIVCLVQGTEGAQEFIENEEGRRIIRGHLRSAIKNHLSHWVKDVYFVSFPRYLAILFHIPYVYKSIREWDQIRYYLLKLIEEIQKDFGITLHAGVGSVYNEPLSLNQPYREARKALGRAISEGSLLCFYEELTKDQNLQKCIEYISNYFHEDLSIKKVANKVHLSHTYFSRLFKKELGVSFVEYVTNIRIKRAKYLLANTNDTIESIASQVGFNTPNYFSSIFKKQTGMSPSEYREAHIITVNE
ncbi:helix-turn-helix transcriptional regulator [Calidifontibacillus erzurumensis]|uniref:AraC family transcriptional regulator n=1 Tax=Calidifontibacillus erzurumensis TaxID=2741433 RepID=A0A8J8GCS6_9BACI|nr:helix-turn-helix domain-containing protein [Calidifontibacillus erzurumensis]NSL51555.1 AraC family transcriptional regulator [Calidifontibacillus erzurumensis]